MRKTIFAVLAATSAFAAMPALAQVTYIGTHSVGTGSVTLSLTTDGTIGALAKGNMLDWSILLDLDGTSVELNSKNSQFGSFVGTSLQATAGQILFDFGGNGTIQWNNYNTGNKSAYCMDAVNSFYSCVGGLGSEIVQVDGPIVTQKRSDLFVLGAVPSGAVPEPAAWGMVIGGFGLAGMATRRRVRTKIAYA